MHAHQAELETPELNNENKHSYGYNSLSKITA